TPAAAGRLDGSRPEQIRPESPRDAPPADERRRVGRGLSRGLEGLLYQGAPAHDPAAPHGAGQRADADHGQPPADVSRIPPAVRRASAGGRLPAPRLSPRPAAGPAAGEPAGLLSALSVAELERQPARADDLCLLAPSAAPGHEGPEEPQLPRR